MNQLTSIDHHHRSYHSTLQPRSLTLGSFLRLLSVKERIVNSENYSHTSTVGLPIMSQTTPTHPVRCTKSKSVSRKLNRLSWRDNGVYVKVHFLCNLRDRLMKCIFLLYAFTAYCIYFWSGLCEQSIFRKDTCTLDVQWHLRRVTRKFELKRSA